MTDTTARFGDEAARFGPRVWMEPDTLSRLRKERNLTQEELARKAGITKNTIGNLEKGHGQPRMGTAAAIAAALDVPLSELIGDNPVLRPKRTRSNWDV